MPAALGHRPNQETATQRTRHPSNAEPPYVEPPYVELPYAETPYAGPDLPPRPLRRLPSPGPDDRGYR
ncbi:hypothetical protein EHYA_00115 [Embleya hyalina]|uniref:Uncharacterized protein n=1 Tax=Embleya hyalina TaxID=516124 RepID=A0A401YD03_9ACTN|nr:hypothetical protein EHYA_00115 [Embleya hyalina]